MPIVIAVAVALRLPLLNTGVGADEGGFLLIGGQWHDGASLYGDHWVDRPPVLISLFALAEALGGPVALRLIGCVAMGVTVYAVSRAARAIAGTDLAAFWAAVVAAALLNSSLTGAFEVNGELLAAPFVAGAVALLAAALHRPAPAGRTPVVSLLLAAGAGALGVGAVLVKQNFVDVFVIAFVVLLAFRVTGRLSTRELLRFLAAGVAGSVISLALILVWTASRGTSLSELWFALYPFRLEAGAKISEGGSEYAVARLVLMLRFAVVSGVLPLMLVAAVAAWSRPVRGPWVLALMSGGFFAAFSIGMGGAFWLHYLLQTVVTLSIMAGILADRLAARPAGLLRWGLALIAVLALVTWPIHKAGEHLGESHVVGRSIAAVSEPGDTLVTIYGHPDVNYASGLPSPYEHLWSLPVRTLDPDLSELSDVMRGGRAPTWLVVWNYIPTWGVDAREFAGTLSERYHKVATTCERRIYLRDDAIRDTPTLPPQCPEPTFSQRWVEQRASP